MSRVDYVGDWHKHPSQVDRPSGQDRETARHIVTDDGWNRVEAVFPIAIVDGKQVRMRAFLMYRFTSDFEEMPIEIVPDTDPRVVRVLIGTDGHGDA